MIDMAPMRIAVFVVIALASGCRPSTPPAEESEATTAGTTVAPTPAEGPPRFAAQPVLAEHERLITILGSNDMHGGAGMTAMRWDPRKGQLFGGHFTDMGDCAFSIEGNYGPCCSIEQGIQSVVF